VVAWKQIQNRKVEKEGKISEEGKGAEVRLTCAQRLVQLFFYDITASSVEG
jgi:hypothetical protein